MTLKAVVNSLDDIPENLKEEYTEKDGKFYLDLDDTIRTHSAVNSLSTALTSLKTQKADLTAKVAALTAKVVGLPDDFDPMKYADIVTELETLRNDPNRDKDSEKKLQTARDQYEQRLRTAEAQRVADIAAKDAELTELGGALQKVIVDDGLTKALVAAGVGKEFLKASSAMLKSSVKVIQDEVNGDRKPVVETDLGEIPLDQYISGWAKSDEGKVFVKNPAGSGAPGSGNGNGNGPEVNPWAAGTVNLTEQGNIIKSDKVKAERLMKLAGVSTDRINAFLGR